MPAKRCHPICADLSVAARIAGTAGALALFLGAAPAIAAGGPHLVDDAGIVPPDSCELEAYANLTGGKAWRVVVSPTCALAKIGAIEAGIIVAFEGPDFHVVPGVSAKMALGRLGPMSTAFEISMGFDPEDNRFNHVATNVPASFDIADWLEFNANAGVEFEPGSDPIATFGLGLLVEPEPGWQLVAEIAGRNARPVRSQFGVRYTHKALTFDLLYSNAIDETRNSSWISLGIVWAFGIPSGG